MVMCGLICYLMGNHCFLTSMLALVGVAVVMFMTCRLKYRVIVLCYSTEHKTHSITEAQALSLWVLHVHCASWDFVCRIHRRSLRRKIMQHLNVTESDVKNLNAAETLKDLPKAEV